MRFGLLAFVAALALTASSAVANDVANNITAGGGSTFFGALHSDNVDFTDVFTFNVAGNVQVDASLISIGGGANNIDFVSADLNGTPLTLSPNGFLETGYTAATLNLTGPLVLTVKGKSGAAGGVFATYSGTMNVIVPEPSTIAACGVLGAMGLVALRRRRS